MALIAQWKFDGNLVDSIGTNNGVAHGNVTYETGKRNQAARMDGSTYIDAGTTLNMSAPFSIMYWVKADTKPGITWKTMISKGESVNDIDYNFYLSLSSGISNGLPNQICLAIGDGVNYKEFTTISQLDTTAWHHIAAVFSSSNDMKIVVDGIDWPGYYDGISTGPVANTKKLIIGAADTLLSEAFVGLLDDMKLYNHAVTASEIANDINPPAPVDCTTVNLAITVQ